MAAGHPVRALIVYAHPEPTSFCGAMKDAAVDALLQAGASVEVSDLYAEQFNPVAGRHDFISIGNAARFHYQEEQLLAAGRQTFADDIVREQGRVAHADLLLFVFPLWWGGVPAILKGWFDRVLAYGFAYADGKRYDEGYFKGRRGLLAIATGGTPQRFTAGGSYGEMSTVLHGVQHCMLEYLGLETREPFVAYAAPRVSAPERDHYLARWRDIVTAACSDAMWVEQLQRSRIDFHPVPAPAAEASGGWANRN